MSIHEDGNCFDQKYPRSPTPPICPVPVKISYCAELRIRVVESREQIETEKAEHAYLEILSKIGPSREISIDEPHGDEPGGDFCCLEYSFWHLKRLVPMNCVIY